MCGIVGGAGLSIGNSDNALTDAFQRSLDHLKHRGPDDQGLWREVNHGVVLGQRRLSVIDLSANGHQPMASSSGRFWITYNGEIYNFSDLRKELEAAGASRKQ
jgi:asparagine synthase (glutamine-hydrolysing)